MSIVLLGSTSGSITLQEPAVAGSNTISLPAVTGTVVVAGQNSAITSGTSVSASSTSVDFTSIPSWVKRITVMLNGVSTNGTSNLQIQTGAGSVTTSGYACYIASIDGTNSTSFTSATSGFVIKTSVASARLYNGVIIISSFGSNTWVATNSTSADNGITTFSNSSIALSGALDRVRITTVNGTDTFDAGSINILYE